MTPNPKSIRSFANTKTLDAWMRKHHASAPELWLKIHKKGSGLVSVTPAEALDVMLCWGWIDGIRKAFDAQSFLQRYTQRRSKSLWSQINRVHVARLIKARRMAAPGRKQIELAKADGRWKAAYAPMRGSDAASIPPDLRKAIRANAKADKKFQTLNNHNLFALRFRINNLKTAEGRAKKIAVLVATLARGETIVPDRVKSKTKR